jgi:hypothetical protein
MSPEIDSRFTQKPPSINSSKIRRDCARADFPEAPNGPKLQDGSKRSSCMRHAISVYLDCGALSAFVNVAGIRSDAF